MSKLIYCNPNGGELEMAFEGSPAVTLSQALDYFMRSADESRHRILSGQIADVPECIVDRCRQAETERQAGVPIHQFTIVPLPRGGYNIWIGDGPDRYQLID